MIPSSGKDAHDHDPSHEPGDGEVHPHIGSYAIYGTVFGALICLTLLTVFIASIHLGPANFTVAVIVASIKAALVCTIFMHLKDENRFYSLIVVAAIVFIGVFFTYTTNDTSHRAQLDMQGGMKANLETGEKAPGSYEAPAVPAGSGGEKEGVKH